MPGITRIHITNTTNGRGGWRFEKSRKMEPHANELYFKMFDQIGMPLQAGVRTMDCSKEEFMAGYDYQLGIDVILRFMNDQQATLQEKYLFTARNTLTVEWMQDWRREVQGDWYNLRCQYYFCGYGTTNLTHFTDGVLVDWSRLQLATAQGRIMWLDNVNKEDGARASFKYIHFDRIPSDVVVYRHRNTSGAPKPEFPYAWAGIRIPGPCRLSANGHECYVHPKNKQGVCRYCGELIAI